MSSARDGGRKLARRVLRGPLAPGQVDDARRVVQLPALERLARQAPPSGQVLDAGSGRSGMYDGLLAGFGEVRHVDHVDLEPPTDRTRPGHDYHRASLTELPFEDGRFDAALCLEVLEHIEDDARAAAELARVLRPGGVLLVSVPTPPAPFDPAHVREGYTEAQLRELLGGAGLELVASERCMHGALRGLIRLWRLQSRLLFGGRPVAYVPRAATDALARVDRRWQPGQPFDLVALARRPA